MKVLVIEDEQKIASFGKGLEAQGFAVEVSRHGDEGYAMALSRPYGALVQGA